eukprot:scaffold257927_cov13-Tisochrysis_lutea.AAC.1
MSIAPSPSMLIDGPTASWPPWPCAASSADTSGMKCPRLQAPAPSPHPPLLIAVPSPEAGASSVLLWGTEAPAAAMEVDVVAAPAA